MSVGVVTYVSCIASSIDASTVSGTPVRDARRHAVSRAERRERADDVLAEPAADRQRRQVHVPVRGEAAAARLQHLLGEVEAVVGTAVTERGDRDRDERRRVRGRGAGLARRRRCRPSASHASEIVGVALRRAQVGEQRIGADRRARTRRRRRGR